MPRTLGGAAILAYVGLFYLFPIGMSLVFAPSQALRYRGDTLLLACTVVGVLAVAAVLARTGVRIPNGWATRLPSIFSYNLLIAVFLGISLPISVRFAMEFGVGFRYSGVGLAAGGFVPQFMFLYKSFYYAFVIYAFLLVLNRVELKTPLRLLLLGSAVIWAFSANGSADIVWLGTALIIAVLGSSSRGLFLADASARGASAKLVRTFAILILAPGLAVGLVFFGFMNKQGVDSALSQFTVERLYVVFEYLHYRLSTFPASIEVVLAYGLDWEMYGRSIRVLWEMFSYRVGSILGFETLKPAIGGINQLNYYEIYAAPTNTRSGASPGVIGSFLYLPLLPLNLLLASLYIAAVINTFNRAARLVPGERPTLFTMFFMIFACFPLLHSPLEAFLKVGPELFTTLMFLYALKKAEIVSVSQEYGNSLPKAAMSARVGF